MEMTDESMLIFRENKSYCACARGKDVERLTCVCGEPDFEPDWKWDEKAKTPTAVVSDESQRVYFHKGYSVGNACIRGDTAMVSGYDYYWEIKMLGTVYGTSMMIGVGTENFNINRSNEQFCDLLGSDSESWGYKFNGKLFHNDKSSEYNSIAGFTIGSIVGVHLNMWDGTLEFFLNRIPLGVAFTGLKNKVLYPMLSSTAAHSVMKLIYAHSQPYSLTLLSLKTLTAPLLGSLPPGLKACSKSCWWLFPKSSRLKTDTNKKMESSLPQHGIYVLIDSDEEEDTDNMTGCHIIAHRMKHVLENSRMRGYRPEGTTNEGRHFSRPIRVYRHRFRPWMDY